MWLWLIQCFLLLVAFITIFFLQYFGLSTSIDLWVGVKISFIGGEILSRSMNYVSDIFGPIMIFTGSVVFLLLLILYQRILMSQVFALHIMFSLISLMIIKYSVQRIRPSQVPSLIDQYSFPSGHATLSVAFFGFLLWFLHKRVKTKTILSFFYIFIIVIILAVGFSRIFLGLHWLTDVIGGYFLGLFWLSFFTGIYDRHC